MRTGFGWLAALGLGACGAPNLDGVDPVPDGGWLWSDTRVAATEAAVVDDAAWPEGAVQQPRDPLLYDDDARLARLAGTVVITGDVVVRGVTSLAPLSRLRQVDGSLTIEDSPALTSLGGLDALERVSGSLTLRTLPGVASLAPLADLVEVGGDLRLMQLAGLASLEGLEALSMVGGGVALHELDVLDSTAGLLLSDAPAWVSVLDAPLLADLAMLSAVTEVRGDLSVRRAGLVDLTGAEQLATVHGALVLAELDALTSLRALAALHTVGGDLRFVDDDALVEVFGLEGLAAVGGSLVFDGNAVLFDTRGLIGLAEVDSVEFVANDALDTLQGLDALRSVPGLLRIQDNPLLSRFFMSRLTTIGHLHVENNRALRNLRRLGPPTALGGLSLVENRALTGFGWDGVTVNIDDFLYLRRNGLVSLADVVFTGALAGAPSGTADASITLSEHTALRDVAGLSGITSTPGRVMVVSNDALTSLAGFANLTSAGDFDIYGNDLIASLAGLEALASVAGRFSVSATPLLTDFDPLAGLVSVGELELLVNDGICLDDVEALQAQLGVIANHDALPCEP